MADYVTMKQFYEAEGLEDWRVVGDGACAYFRTGTFGLAAKFLSAIAGLEGAEAHSPDVDIRSDGVTVRLLTFEPGYMGMSQRDIELGRRISGAARSPGLVSDPAAVQSLLVIPGAPRIAEVMPFWQAVLGYQPRADSPDEDLVDPRNRTVPFWFEQMREPAPGGGGAIHVAVWVPHDQAEARIAAALAAGGHVVRDQFAPAWVTLADSAGNEVDVSTTTGRG